MRRREAPIARRTAISRSRAVARASIRFARFAHAISSTSPVTPSRIFSGVAILPGAARTRRCRRGSTRRITSRRSPSRPRRCSAASSVSAKIAGDTALRCALCACSTVQPGFSRPKTAEKPDVAPCRARSRAPRMIGSAQIGERDVERSADVDAEESRPRSRRRCRSGGRRAGSCGRATAGIAARTRAARTRGSARRRARSPCTSSDGADQPATRRRGRRACRRSRR